MAPPPAPAPPPSPPSPPSPLPSPPGDSIPPPKADFTAPPPYEASNYTTVMPVVPQSKLPTYEEVQMEKNMHVQLPMPQQLPPMHPPGRNNHPHHGPGGAVTFIAIDSTDADSITTDNTLLGTDLMFIVAFLIAFLFNWIGFLMLTCFCHTIASRYGALSGFGLSLTKWTLIVKNSTDLASHENSWLWWLIMAFGFLISIRALIQYISIKRTWRLLSTSAQERLLFFY